MIRINQYLSRSGIASRRQADNLIAQQKVRVNGTVLTELGTKVDPSADTVEYQTPTGKWEAIQTQPEQSYIIYALYKPKGYITSTKQTDQTPTVMSLLPKSPRVYPVGRLDKESEGLLLCTNDGDLAAKLTHPRSHLAKSYTVHCGIPHSYTENILKSKLGRIAKGVSILGRKTLPSDIVFNRYLRPGMVEITITLREGRNRQIRRMLGSIDLEVHRLIRTRIGNLSLDQLNLQHGTYSVVKAEDIL